MDNINVSDKDLKDLYRLLIDNLSKVILSGDASPKDKELAYRIIKDNQITIDMFEDATELANKMDLFGKELPFDVVEGGRGR